MTTAETPKPFDIDEFVFSASSIKSYLHCGRKFKFEKIDKLPAPPETSHFRWLGKLVHTSIYQSIARFNSESEEIKRWDYLGTKPNKADALAFFEKGWQGQPAEDDPDTYMKSLYPFEIGDKPVGRFFPRKDLSLLNYPVSEQKQLEQGWKIYAQAMVETGLDVVSKIHKIHSLEYSLEFTIGGKKARGFIDILALDEEGKFVIYDFKTSWRKPSKADMEKDIQFILYSYAIKELFGLDYYPKAYFVHLKTGSLAELEMTDAILEKTTKKILTVFKNIQNNLFFDDMGGVLCNYCDFKSICYNT